MSPEAYGAILEEVRKTIGQAGRITETLDDSLAWEFKPRGGEWTRRVQVSASPGGGRTRIRITEYAGAEQELIIASVMGGIAAGLAVFAGLLGRLSHYIAGHTVPALAAKDDEVTKEET